jgi:hypothetical protein
MSTQDNPPTPGLPNTCDPIPDDVVIGNPETKPKHSIPFGMPTGGSTYRQRKNKARLEKMLADPHNLDDASPRLASKRGKGKRRRLKRAKHSARLPKRKRRTQSKKVIAYVLATK